MSGDEDRVHRPSAEGRHIYGPRPLGQLLPLVTRAAYRKRSPAAAQMMADWPQVVGPALAATTAPRRLSGATLTIACSGPVALELQHLQTELMGRINGYLGRAAITRLRFVQELLPARPVPALPVPKATATLPLPGVQPGALYDALQALGNAVRRT